MGKIKRLAMALAGAAAGAKIAKRSYDAVQTLFEPHTKRAQETLIGQTCTLSTLKVTESFGQAVYDDGAGDLILQVRCREDNTLGRNDEVLIVDYDPTQNVYEVEAL
ncbi:MAG: hypothetical protein AAFX99_08325 [Myxococcota bacterium]